MNGGAASLLAEAAALLSGTTPAEHVGKGPFQVGVDLGTATMVLLVLDGNGRPRAGRLEPAQVVRDGLVVDFIGAVDRLRLMKAEVESELGTALSSAAAGYPPGVPSPERQAIANVLHSAELDCRLLIDEPTAANHVLGLQDGAVVDVGGGTTGIAVLQEGRVVYSADEATGGTHFNLVIAGALDIDYERAEQLKETPGEQSRLVGVVRPVMEKVGTIIARHIDGWSVPKITLVGGACQFPEMDTTIAEITGRPTERAPNPQLVTPMGLALAELAERAAPTLENSIDGSRR